MKIFGGNLSLCFDYITDLLSLPDYVNLWYQMSDGLVKLLICCDFKNYSIMR